MTIVFKNGVKKQITAQLKKDSVLKKQRGMTLLEIIIVLGIIGVISSGVVVLAQRAFDTKALTDLANNASSVRVAIKDAYGPSGQYPAEATTATLGLINAAAVRNDNTSPIGKLVALGKISPEEGLNNISGNYISIGAGAIAGRSNGGFFIVLNGLNQSQCRGLLNQMGNQWDYVQVGASEPSGTYTTHTVNLAAEATGFTPASGTGDTATPAKLGASGIYRSLHTTGANLLTPDAVVGACANNTSNSLILGSR